MIIASIDIGTNTILLLIAEINSNLTQIKVLRDEIRIPRIGKGLKPDSPISKEKEDLLLKTLSEYKKIIAQYSCEQVILTATNAFRIASNAAGIVKRIKDELGFDVTIVPGKDEAMLSYLGAVSSFPDEGKYMVIDIGGGSTEIIFGDKSGIKFSNSYQVGAVSLTERFLRKQTPDKNEIKEITGFVEGVFSQVNMNDFSADKVIAIAGTPTTLACIKADLREFDESAIEGSVLTKAEMPEFVNMLAKLSPDEIKSRYGSVVTGREDVIFAGTAILYILMQCFNIQEVIVSTKGIRYGAIINYLMG